MTVIEVELRPLLPSPAIGAAIATALAHRAAGPLDYCVACGWHHPCPAFFKARRVLITAGVHPRLWLREPAVHIEGLTGCHLCL
jgi:hypothetical protein